MTAAWVSDDALYASYMASPPPSSGLPRSASPAIFGLDLSASRPVERASSMEGVLVARAWRVGGYLRCYVDVGADFLASFAVWKGSTPYRQVVSQPIGGRIVVDFRVPGSGGWPRCVSVKCVNALVEAGDQ